MNSLTSKQLGILLALLATICGAAFMIPWKLASSLGLERDMVFILVFVAALFNTVTLIYEKRRRSVRTNPSRPEVLISIAFALLTILGNQASAEAVRFLSPSVVTTIMRAEVVFITIMAWIFLKELVGIQFGFALLISFIGFYIMQPSLNISGEWWLGAFSATLAALSFATMAVITRRYITIINVTAVNTMRLWISLILWLPIYRTFPDWQSWSLEFFFLVSLAAILGPGMGRLLIMNSAKYIEARFSAILVASSPVFALILEAFILGSLPSNQEIVGGTVMVVGIGFALVSRSPKKCKS